jgi:predicted nuclease of predicted toxin-antitoxin system
MVKLLLDENLSQKLAHRLSTSEHHVTHVSLEGMQNTLDNSIWEFAKENVFTIVTKDYDFSDMSHLLGCPPKVIKLTCGNRTTGFIFDLLQANMAVIKVFTSNEKCYLELF